MAALFYPIAIAKKELQSLVLGFDKSATQVEFASATGNADQALGVPFLPGMDAIVVKEARVVLRCAPKDVDVDSEDYQAKAHPSAGVYLSFGAPARLRKVELGYDFTPAEGETVRVIVRDAGARGALVDGVPLFADTPFPAPAPMYPPTLGGMSLRDLDASRHLLTLPPTLGSAWLFQLALGAELKDLKTKSIKPEISRVVCQALPRDLSVTLAPDAEALTLWSNPGVLLPESGEQEVSFAPLAQKHLSQALSDANQSDAAATPTLGVPLRFHSADAAAAIAIVEQSLVAEYQAKPLGERATLALRGGFAKLTLDAPASRKAKAGTLQLTAQLLGRELNGASPEPSLVSPSSGLRVGLTQWVSAATAVAPFNGGAPGSTLELASVRVLLACPAAGEIVLELRADLAGSPGEMVAAPVVLQTNGPLLDWLEFILPSPLKVVAAQAPIWVSLRANSGEFRWYTANPGTAGAAATAVRSSSDRGLTWSPPSPLLVLQGSPLVQLFHRVEQAPRPAIRVQQADRVLDADWLKNGTSSSTDEYVDKSANLPASMLAALVDGSGSSKVKREFLVFSRSALDLIIEGLTLSYDPFASTLGARS